MARSPVYVVATLALLVTPLALGQGTVWRCMQDGRSQYTNIQKETTGRECTVVSREVSVVYSQPQPVAQTRSDARPANFPRVDPETQRLRDDTRRKILESELSAEAKSLAEAKTKLAEQETVRNGNERNFQKVIDRLQPYQETVERHERNVMALQQELTRLK
jgi:hypothetical protein